MRYEKPAIMTRHWQFLGATILLVALAFFAAESAMPSLLPVPIPMPSDKDGHNSMVPKDSPYHKHPPKGELPPTLDPPQFKNKPAANVAYTIAAKIKEVLYQEPCLCGCGVMEGHKSLLDCFMGTHGEECEMCQYEAIFCFEQRKRGRSPKQIRNAMLQNKWGDLKLNQYVAAYQSSSSQQP